MTESTKKLVVFDLDGTLFDDRHRFKYIGFGGSYEKYHKALGDDAIFVCIMNEFEIAVKNRNNPCDVAIWTARPERFIGATRDKFYRSTSVPKGMLGNVTIEMRSKADECHKTSSVDLKSRLLGKAINAGYNDITMYDDREDVLKACRDIAVEAGVRFLGILCVNGAVAKHITADQPIPWSVSYPSNCRCRTVELVDEIQSYKEHEEEGKLNKEKRTAADILAEMADTFRERNANYKDNAHNVEAVMQALFPNGVTLHNNGDFHMWHLFELLIIKLTRFANSDLKHQDSIHDLAIYAAMCENLVNDHKITFKK